MFLLSSIVLAITINNICIIKNADCLIINEHMDCMRMIRYNTSCFRPFSKTGPLLCLRQSKYTNANEIFLCPNDDPKNWMNHQKCAMPEKNLNCPICPSSTGFTTRPWPICVTLPAQPVTVPCPSCPTCPPLKSCNFTHPSTTSPSLVSTSLNNILTFSLISIVILLSIVNMILIGFLFKKQTTIIRYPPRRPPQPKTGAEVVPPSQISKFWQSTKHRVPQTDDSGAMGHFVEIPLHTAERSNMRETIYFDAIDEENEENESF